MAAAPPHYFLLDLKKVPSATWSAHSEREAWFEHADTAGPEGFAPGSLATLGPCPVWIQVERGMAIFVQLLALNVLPVGIPAALLARLCGQGPRMKHVAWLVALQVSLVFLYPAQWRNALRRILRPSQPLRGGGGGAAKAPPKAFAEQQLDVNFVMERQMHHYFDTKWVIPRSLAERPADAPPAIICITPHGVLPLGTSAAMSKVFGRASQFAAAPVLFRLPGGAAARQLERLGCFPAGKAGILRCLESGDHAGLILDGIAGMFCRSKGASGDQELWLLRRKAVVAIALQAGAPIIPAYCFGTTDLCRVFDPLFGLLRWLSIRLDISLTPFLGRWWLPLGPPARRPLAMCFGDPVQLEKPPDDTSREDFQKLVDAKHSELLDAFRRIFDSHKAAYGQPDARLTFV